MIVVCAGMPRSGSTLQFNIVKQAVLGSNWIEVEWVKNDRICKKLKAIKSNDTNSTIYLKTHNVPECIFQGEDKIKILTSIRDPRDVAASNKNAFNNSVAKSIATLSKSYDLLDQVREKEEVFLYVSNYTNLVFDLYSEVKKISDFLVVCNSETRCKKISEEVGLNIAYGKSRTNKFNVLNHIKRNLLLGLGVAPYKDADLRLHPNHISEYRGVNNYYSKVLTPDEICLIEDSLLSRYQNHMEFVSAF